MTEIILSGNGGELDDVASYIQTQIRRILNYNFGAIKNLEWEIKFETI